MSFRVIWSGLKRSLKRGDCFIEPFQEKPRRAHVGTNTQKIGVDFEGFLKKGDRVVVVLLVQVKIAQLYDRVEVFRVLFNLGSEFLHALHVERRGWGFRRTVAG